MIDPNIEQFKSWNKYGKEIAEVRDKLLNITTNPEYQKLLKDQKINSLLTKACNYIDKFKSKAEDKMFQKVKPDINDNKWLYIFYRNNIK